MPQSYINPTIFTPTITARLAKEITARNDTDWSESSSIIWISQNSPTRDEYSLDEIERTKSDFKTNFGNLRKYPKMIEEDWA